MLGTGKYRTVEDAIKSIRRSECEISNCCYSTFTNKFKQ